jgi:xylulokinase
MNCLVGLELGTTNIKIGVFSTEGELIFKKSCLANIKIGENASAIAYPEEWWNSVKQLLQETCSKISKYKISGISVGSNGPTLIALDEKLNPVGPSLLWMDRRANKEAEYISKKLGKKLNDLAWFVPRALWVKKQFPNTFKRIKYFCQPLDYINAKLTGNIKTVICSDHIKIWTDEIIQASELDKNLFPKPIKLGNLIGKVTTNASSETGIPENTPIFAATGGADFVEELIGCGVLKNGMVCDRGGTSQGIELCWNKPINKYAFYSVPHPIVPKKFHIAGLMGTTGIALQWYKNMTFDKNTTYKDIFKIAEKSPPGARKIIFLPDLMGARTPWWDVNSKGVFAGISLNHQKEDFIRAILEGIAMGINQIIRKFNEFDVKPKEIRVCGNQAKSPLWNQIKADVTGLPVKVTSIDDSSILGMAIIAGYGAGIYSNISEASKKLVKIDKTYTPNLKNHLLYQKTQSVYEKLYPAMKDCFTDLAKIKY